MDPYFSLRESLDEDVMLNVAAWVFPHRNLDKEVVLNFLTAATVRGSTDNTLSPSARIVLGRVVATGTGACGVRMDWDMMELDGEEDNVVESVVGK